MGPYMNRSGWAGQPPRAKQGPPPGRGPGVRVAPRPVVPGIGPFDPRTTRPPRPDQSAFAPGEAHRAALAITLRTEG